jgi:hypothetical protein
VVTVGFRSGLCSFPDKRQCFAWHSLEHALIDLYVGTDCYHSCLSSCYVLHNPRRDCVNVLLQESTHKKTIRIGSGDRKGHAVGPRPPVHLLECVAFNHCPTSPSHCAGATSCWSHQLFLTDRSTSCNTPVELFPENDGTIEQFARHVADRGPLPLRGGV